MPRFAANLSFMFQEYPFLKRFEAAARAGFQGVEYLSPYDHTPEILSQCLREHGLHQVLFNGAMGDWQANERGLAALPGREAAFEASVQQALSYAQALGCTQLHVMAGIQPANVSQETCEAVYRRNLRYAADYFEPHGIRVLIEPINTRDMPGYMLHTSGQAKRIIEVVDHPNLFLQMDLYHCQIMEGDLATRIKTLFPLISHFQIAGNPERHEPDLGEVHYPYLFDLIDRLDYQGWIGCEYHPLRDTLSGLGWGRPYGLGDDLI
jgi:2-dehydrotetronate isomerase